MRNHKFKEIYVDGYKNLIDCRAKLHDFNVLVGPNNSGKSNFLEVFAFVNGLVFGADTLKKDIFEQASAPRGNSSICQIEKHRYKPITISFLLEDFSQKKSTKEIWYSLSIQCSSQILKSKKSVIKIGFISEELSAKDKAKTGKAINLVKRTGELVRVKTNSGNFSKKRIDSTVSILKAVPMFYPDLDKLDPYYRSAADAIMNLLSTNVISLSPTGLRNRIGRGGHSPFDNILRITAFDLLPAIAKIKKDKLLYKQFINILCQILDIEDARFLEIPIPEKVRKSSKTLPKIMNFFQLKLQGQQYSNVEDFSDGTLETIAILEMLLSPERESQLICVEEPENYLHPKALKTLVSYLIQKATDIQILITTHSPYLLNFVNPEDVVIARIHEDGGTRFERVENIKELRRRLARGYVSFGDFLETEFKKETEAVI